jgi:DNA polymerase I-like protein with 3'-5' exonuclease and polymerase domains
LKLRSKLQEALQKLENEERVFCYFDFDEDASMQARIRSLALAGANSGWVAQLQNGGTTGLVSFRELLERSKPPKVVHNTKAARVTLAQVGITLCGADWDTMLMSYLVQPNRSNHQFAEIAFAQLEKTPGPEPDEALQRWCANSFTLSIPSFKKCNWSRFTGHRASFS